jgi:hypothetical protein
VLYLEHSTESLSRGGPWLLGTILPGSCVWRILSDPETAIHGGSSRRRLYGCVVTLCRPNAAAQGVSGGGEVNQDELVQQLLTWSQVCGTVCRGVLKPNQIDQGIFVS